MIRTCLLVPWSEVNSTTTCVKSIQKESEHGTQVANVPPEPNEAIKNHHKTTLLRMCKCKAATTEWITCHQRAAHVSQHPTKPVWQPLLLPHTISAVCAVGHASLQCRLALLLRGGQGRQRWWCTPGLCHWNKVARVPSPAPPIQLEEAH